MFARRDEMDPKLGTISDAEWKSLNDRRQRVVRIVDIDSDEYAADVMKWRQMYENRHQN
jgi:hypothetical protein